MSETRTESAGVHWSAMPVPPPASRRSLVNRTTLRTPRGKSHGSCPSPPAQVARERLIHPEDVRAEPALDPGLRLHHHPRRRPDPVEQRAELPVLADETGVGRAMDVRAGVGGRRHDLLLGGEVLHDVLAEEVEEHPDLVWLPPRHRLDERPEPPEELLVLPVDLGVAERERGVPLHR